MATDPSEINYDATYQVDRDTGSLVRSSSKMGSLGFKGFYEGRPELTGTHQFNHEWRVTDRPGIRPGDSGPMKLPYRSGRGFQYEEPVQLGEEPSDISGVRPLSNVSNLRPSEPSSRSSYDLRNVRTVAGAIGGPAMAMARPWGGSAPRGTQFDGIGGTPSPLMLGPAGSSSVTTKTETKGKRAGQMAWDF